MTAARIAGTTAFLALILPVAALVFTKDTWAASGNVQVCQPNTSCTVGEFLYNDSYAPITTATCTITSRYPSGTLFLNAVNMPASAQGDGWYAHTFTTPSTLGLYRTEVKCTTGSETLALDKSFEVQSPPAAVATANDVAGAVWGYSSRSLTTFGSLISDLWNSSTRTLTDNSSSSDISTIKSDVSTIKKDLSSVKDVTSSTTSTTNITNIQNISNTTNNLLEQLINRPTIENGIEESSFTTTELQTKLEKSNSIANQLLTSGTYLKSKTNLIKGGGGDITKALGQLEVVVNSIDGQIDWISDQWNLPVSPKLKSQNQKIASSLKSAARTPAAIRGLSTEVNSFLKLIGTDSDTSSSATLFGQLHSQKGLLSKLDKNYLEANTLLSDISKSSKPQTELVTQINSLSKQVAAINQLPKMDQVILAKSNLKTGQKQLKNKTLSLRGIVEANRQFIAQGPNRPLSSLWLEEGSIVFKSLISNPSKSISQNAPVKYYLPKEVTRENITKVEEDLTLNYDSEKDQYYVSGSFTLGPGETKTISVTVDDSVFEINDAEITTMRKQAEELSKPLNNTAYFAQGVTLKTDIDASLDKIGSLQKNATTPELKIRGYRESIIEYKAAKERLERLKEITTNAGSVGTLFGFVGGAQALAVWGLIIIMVAGFIFLALYMRTLRGSEKYSVLEQRLPPIVDSFENYEEVTQEEKPKPSNNPQKRFYLGKPFKYMAVLIISVLIGGSSIYALGNLRQAQIKAVPASQRGEQAPPQEVLGSSKENIASDSARLNLDLEVNILVPEESTVTMHSEPSINSPVLTSLNTSQKAKEVSRQDIWVKVVLQDPEGKNIEGWVDSDFVETEAEIGKLKSPIEPSATVTVKDTPTGFLRVRKTPGGEEITKISPGEEYPSNDDQSGWVQIVLEDGTAGWVSKQYISYGDPPQGGINYVP